jgi:hypothetical protein
VKIDDYTSVAESLLAEANAIEVSKRPGYTGGSEDVLANFKRIADRTGLTPGQVLTVYFLKHVDAITAILCRPDLPVSEEVEGRFADGINYLKLGYALVLEEWQRGTRKEGYTRDPRGAAGEEPNCDATAAGA